MTDTARIDNNLIAQVRGHARSFETARQAKARANVFQQQEEPQTKKALNRLDKILSTGRPLRDDVPRGYYVNIQV